MGIGYTQCDKLTEMYRNAPPGIGLQMPDAMVGSWSSGFMSAANLARHLNKNDTQNLNSMELTDKIIAIRRYCRAHPTEQMFSAVADLFDRLGSNADGELRSS